MRRPGLTGQSIKPLSPPWVAFRDAGAVEIVGAVVRHPQLRHQASGSSVSDAGMRHNQEHKSSRLTRSLSGTTEINAADRGRVKKMLGL